MSPLTQGLNYRSACDNRKDKCRFFRFPSNTKEYKKWEDSIHQILIPPKRNDLNAIATVHEISREPALCHLKMS